MTSEEQPTYSSTTSVDDWYQQSLFEDEIESWLEHIVPAENALYDQAIVDPQADR